MSIRLSVEQNVPRVPGYPQRLYVGHREVVCLWIIYPSEECTVETLKLKPLDPSLEVSPRTKMAEEDKGNHVKSSLRH